MQGNSDHASSAPRARWADTARGIGIILVVYGHALRGIVTAGVYPADVWTRLQDALIYAFHMPLFFLLSGLFVAKSLRAGRDRFLRTRIAALVYPYLLWSVIQALLSMMASNVANNPIGFAELGRILWEPIGQFWFLYALLLCQLVAVLPRRVLLFGVFPASVSAVYALGEGSIVLAACLHFPYFLAGLLLTIDRLQPIEHRQLLIAGAAASWLAFALLFAWSAEGIAEPMRVWLLGFSGTFGTLAISRLLPDRGLLPALGRASMPIFLMHTICTAATRGLLLALIPGLPLWAMVSLLTLAGLALPYIAYRLARRWRLDVVLGFDRASRAPARLTGESPNGTAQTKGALN